MLPHAGLGRKRMAGEGNEPAPFVGRISRRQGHFVGGVTKPRPEIELNAHSCLTDIVPERFDAGVRLGEQVAKDMIAVRIGPVLRMAVVASPAFRGAWPTENSPRPDRP
jgi:hypothetical protein